MLVGFEQPVRLKQMSANQGPDLRFNPEAKTKALITKSDIICPFQMYLNIRPLFDLVFDPK